MAELLNTFFIDYPKNLISTQSTHVTQSPSAVNQVEHAFAIPRITKKRVSELLLSIPSHKATGDDGISVKILKIAAPAALPSLTRLLNLCISNKVFPSAWKVAKVTPVFKGNGSRSDCNNYRPISVLPVLSNLCDFLTSNGIFYKLQSGFTKSFSTETALIRLIDELLLNLDKENVNGLVMIDHKLKSFRSYRSNASFAEAPGY